MSQLANFTQLPVKAVQLLIPAAMPRRRLFRKPVYVFQDYLDQHGRDLGTFDADGFYIVIALLYLRKHCGVNLLDGNKGLTLMAQALSKYQGSFFTFFTPDDRQYEGQVRGVQFEASKLKRVCEELGAEYELYSDLGTLKLAADKIAEVLSQIPDDHVVLVCVG